MKGDSKVIEHLNKALYNELVAINQYFLHARMFKNWGLKELAEHEYKESIDEMKHADRLIERILFLEDAPSHIQRLQAAAANNDIAAMVAPAHTLKSSSANLGALALSAVAKRIEFGARTQTLAKPTLAVLMLENEFRRAKAALRALDDG